MEKHKLSIIEVKEARTVGAGMVVEFYATNSTNKRQRYLVWNRQLFDVIKANTTIEADIDVKTSEKLDQDGNPYTNRNIVQVYQNGEPVVKKAAGGARYGKSPEEIASIERQCAAKVVTELEIAGKPVKGELLQLRDNWLRKALTA